MHIRFLNITKTSDGGGLGREWRPLYGLASNQFCSLKVCLDWWNDIKWNGMRWDGIKFHCLDYKKMEWNLMISIVSNSITYTILLPFQFKMWVMRSKVLNCGCGHSCGYDAILDIVDKCGQCGCNCNCDTVSETQKTWCCGHNRVCISQFKTMMRSSYSLYVTQ